MNDFQDGKLREEPNEPLEYSDRSGGSDEPQKGVSVLQEDSV